MTSGRAGGAGRSVDPDGLDQGRPEGVGGRGPGGPSRFAVPAQQLEASVRVPLAACVASVAEPPPAVPTDPWAALRWGDGAVADADGD